MKYSEHSWSMSLALDEAQRGYDLGEVPVGAIVTDEVGQVISVGHNIKELENDPCGHAEIVALRMACQKRGNWRLSGCKLYVTLEPCAMCLAACVHARISQLVFGTYDYKAGAISLGYNLYKDSRLNHSFDVIGGVRHYETSRLLSTFFRERRKNYRQGGN